MSELKLVSPLLDNLELVQSIQSGGGISVYLLRHTETGQPYILKHIALPESSTQVDALLFTGAASTEEEAQKYYEQVVDDYVDEFSALEALRGSTNVATYLNYQVCPRENGIGFDLYLLSEKWQTLTQYLANNAMTHLRALNLGLDLCTALGDLRTHRMIHRDVKPSNIYLNGLNSFMLGDLGAVRMENLKYCAMPERMLTEYSAPELGDLLEPINTTIDIYSIGLVLYRILNGNHGPFEDEKTSPKAANKLRIAGTPLPAPLYADYELTEILLKACAYEPADRYQTPDELMQELVLYMKRNRVSDALIVPPIVSDPDLIVSADEAEAEIEPVRFADIEDLDSDFVSSFAPEISRKAVPEPEEDAAPAEPAASPRAEEDPTNPPPFAAPPAGFEDEEDEQDGSAPPPPAVAAPQSVLPENPPPQGKKKGKFKKKIWIPLVIAVLLLAAIATSVYFLVFGGPPLNISAINVTEKGTDFVTVSLGGVKPGQVELQCTDTYGNVLKLPYVAEPVTFDKLTPGTQYWIGVVSTGRRTLTGAITTPVTTTAITEIVSFTADSTMAGQMDLNVIVSGPDPGQWTVRYWAEGVPEQTAPFAGHTVTISQLEQSVPYTFELVAPEGVVLSGESKLTFTPGPAVEITDLKAASLTKTSVKVVWSCAEHPPKEWSVTCTGTDGTTKTQRVQDMAAEFTELVTGETYTIAVTSVGTLTPATITVSPTAATVKSLTATALGADAAKITWATDSAAEAWQLYYYVDGAPDFVQSAVAVTGTETTLKQLVPGASYQFELRSAANEKLSGSATAAVKLEKPGKFSDYGATRFFLGLFERPDKKDWNGKDLSVSATVFAKEQKIAYALESLTGRDAGSEKVSVTAVMKDAKGIPVGAPAARAPASWDSLWTKDLIVGEIPAPHKPGTYKLEVSLNGQLAATKEFTVK